MASAETFFAREGLGGRAAEMEMEGAANGSSGVDDSAADFRATFLAAIFLTAGFFTATVLAAGVSPVEGLVATRLMARFRAGGASAVVPAGVCGVVS